MDDKEMRHMLDNLRLIYAAYDANGDDLSAWPWKAADEIERLHKRCHPSNVVMIGDAGHYVSEAVAAEIERLKKLNKVLEAAFMEAAKQIAKSDPVGVARRLREQGL